MRFTGLSLELPLGIVSLLLPSATLTVLNLLASTNSGTPFGLERPNDVLVDGRQASGQVSGLRRSVCLANAMPDANNVGAASGSRSRKRSCEPGETRNEANDASSTEERKKRMKKNSKQQSDGDGTSSGQKQTKVRRGRK